MSFDPEKDVIVGDDGELLTPDFSPASTWQSFLNRVIPPTDRKRGQWRPAFKYWLLGFGLILLVIATAWIAIRAIPQQVMFKELSTNEVSSTAIDSRLLLTTQTSTSAIGNVDWSEDSKQLIIANLNGGVSIVDTTTGNQVNRLELGANRVDLSLRGDFIAVGGFDDLVVWDLNGEQAEPEFMLAANIGYVEWSTPNGSLLVAAEENGTRVNVWNFRRGRLVDAIHLRDYGGEAGNLDIDWVPPVRDEALVAVMNSAAIVLWGTETQEVTVLHLGEEYPDHERWTDIAWSPDGLHLAAAQILRDGGFYHARIMIWDAYDYSEVQIIDLPSAGNEYPTTYFDWSPDSTRIVTASANSNDITIWDVATGEAVDSLDYGEPVYYVDWSPNSSLLAVCGEFNVRIFDLASTTN